MKLLEAEKRIRIFAGRKRAFKSRELGRIFEAEGETLRSTLRRLVDAGIVERVARDLYWIDSPSAKGIPAIEELAGALRSGEFNFIGMESAASLWSVISQIPVDRLTVVTTGREGEFKTPFGVIEFIHTASSPSEIIANTVDYPGHGLRLATKDYTVRGLLRARRSVHLIDWEEVEDDD